MAGDVVHGSKAGVGGSMRSEIQLLQSSFGECDSSIRKLRTESSGTEPVRWTKRYCMDIILLVSVPSAAAPTQRQSHLVIFLSFLKAMRQLFAEQVRTSWDSAATSVKPVLL